MQNIDTEAKTSCRHIHELKFQLLDDTLEQEFESSSYFCFSISALQDDALMLVPRSRIERLPSCFDFVYTQYLEISSNPARIFDNSNMGL